MKVLIAYNALAFVAMSPGLALAIYVELQLNTVVNEPLLTFIFLGIFLPLAILLNIPLGFVEAKISKEKYPLVNQNS